MKCLNASSNIINNKLCAADMLGDADVYFHLLSSFVSTSVWQVVMKCIIGENQNPFPRKFSRTFQNAIFRYMKEWQYVAFQFYLTRWQKPSHQIFDVGVSKHSITYVVTYTCDQISMSIFSYGTVRSIMWQFCFSEQVPLFVLNHSEQGLRQRGRHYTDAQNQDSITKFLLTEKVFVTVAYCDVFDCNWNDPSQRALCLLQTGSNAIL